MKQLFLLVLCGCCLCACVFQNESPETTNPSPIRLVPLSAPSLAKALAKAQGDSLSPSAAGASEGQANQIDLDTITGTVTEYFMVQNTGSQNISDVEIQTDNPNFTFSPSHISVLAPSNQLNVQQIVALTITHGAITNDSSKFASTLKLGANTATVLFSGSALNGSNPPSPLSEQIALTAYAKLIDITAIDSNGSVDLFHPSGETSSGFAPDLYPIYLVTGDSLTLVNTGNVPLDLNYWAVYPYTSNVELTLGVNDTARVPVSATLSLDGGNVTTNPNKLPVARNGKIYADFLNPVQISRISGRE